MQSQDLYLRTESSWVFCRGSIQV